MTFSQFVSTTYQLGMPLYNQQQTQKQHKPLHQFQINQLLEDINHYVSEIIFIEKDIICTVTKYYLDFYSISIKNNLSCGNYKNEQIIEEKRFIGRLKIDEEIGILLEKEQQQTNQEKQPVNRSTQRNKQSNFDHISIIQKKGITYHSPTNTFYTLLQTTTNKYLVTFKLTLSSSSIPQSHISSKNEQQSIQISNFGLVYDFNDLESKVKYNLQLNPEIIFLPKSQVLILVRKFYSDSFVVIFNPNKLKPPHNSNHHYKPYWSFYINEQCLSSLDDRMFLVNYRQLITRNYLEIDIIDLKHREKIALKIDERVEPMTIKAVQVVQNERRFVAQGQNSDRQQLRIRVFSILKRSQSTYIIDYDTTHHTVIRTYKINNLFLEKLSLYDQSNQCYFLNYIFQGKSWIGVFSQKDLESINKNDNNNNQIKNIISSQELFCKKLIGSSVEHEMDSLMWNVQFGVVLQSRISITTNSLHIKLAKLYNKQLHYIKIVDQLKQTLSPLQDIQFSINLLKLLTSRKEIDE